MTPVLPYQTPNISVGQWWVDLGSFGTTDISAFWDEANTAVFAPVWVNQLITVRRLLVENATLVSGNIDVGLYDATSDGLPQTRLVSSGSTTQSGANAWQAFDIADTELIPGLYYLATVLDNIDGVIRRLINASIEARTRLSMFAQQNAFPLPDSVEPSTAPVMAIPQMMLSRTLL